MNTQQFPALIADRYQVMKCLGKGPRGSVYKVNDKRSNSCRCLKLLSNNRFGETWKRHFRHEFPLLATLSHANLVSYLDCGFWQNQMYITWPYVPGRDLREPSSLSWAALRSAFCQIADCLTYLHGQSVWHMAVHEGNIVISGDTTVLVDYGMAPGDVAHDPEAAQTADGSRPPEWGNQSPLDERMDLYGLGMVMLRAMEAKHALPAADIPLSTNQRLERLAERGASGAQQELFAMVRSLIADDPSQRVHSSHKVWQVLRQQSPEQAKHAGYADPHPLSTPLIGRSEEQALVSDFIRHESDGPALMIVEGPPGVGKSRLVNSLKYHPPLKARQFIFSHCSIMANHAYQPFVTILRKIIPKAGTPRVETYRSYIDTVLHCMRTGTEASHSYENLEQKRLRLYSRLTECLLTCPGKHVIVIDNLQWASEATLSLLKFLAIYLATASRRSICIIGLCHPSALRGMHPLAVMAANLGHRSAIVRLPLKPLTESASRALWQLIPGTEEIPETEHALRASRGYPLVIETCSRACWEVAKPSQRRSLRADLLDGPPASTLEKAMSLQLNRLEKDELQVAKYLSVLGRSMQLSELYAFPIQSETFVLLRRLLRKGIIRVSRGAADDFEVDFSHPEWQEQVYMLLSPKEKKQLHREAAKVFADHYGRKLPVSPEELAEHSIWCQNKRQAFRFSMRAAEHLYHCYAFREAMMYFNRALAISEEYPEITEPKEIIAILKQKVLIREIAGDYQKAYTDYLNLLHLAKAHDTQLEGEILGSLAETSLKLGQYKRCLAFCRQQQDKLPGNQPEREAHILTILAEARYGLRHSSKAQEYLNRAMAIVIKTKQQTLKARILYDLGRLFYDFDKYRKALQLFQRAYRIVSAKEDKLRAAAILAALGKTRLAMRHYQPAKRNFQDALAIFDQVSRERDRAEILHHLGIVHFKLNDSTLALAYYEKALETARHLNDVKLQALSCYHISRLYMLKYEFLLFQETIHQALAFAKQSEWRSMTADISCLKGEALVRLGDYAKALDYFKDALHIYWAVNDEEKQLHVLYRVGVTNVYMQKHSRASEYFIRALQKAIGLAKPDYEKQITLALGKSYEARDRLKQAGTCVASVTEWAESQADTRFLVECLMLRLRIYAKQQAVQGKELIKRLSAFIAHSEDLDVRWRYYMNKGFYYEMCGDWSKAKIAFKTCRDIIQAVNERISDKTFCAIYLNERRRSRILHALSEGKHSVFTDQSRSARHSGQ